MAYDVAEAVGNVLASGIDPQEYAHHDTLGEDLVRSPYPFLDEVRRRRGAVFELPDGMMDGVDIGGLARVNKDYPCFAALSYDAVSAVFLGGAKVFGQGLDQSYLIAWGETPVTVDPPLHTPLRELTNKALNRLQIQRLERDVIRPAAKLLTDNLLREGGGNLVTAYTGLLPFLVITNLLGVNPGDFRWIMNRTRTMMALGVDWEAGHQAALDLRAYLEAVYEDRLARPGDDLISDLIAAELDGQRLSKEQVLAFCRILLPAGIETTTKQFGILLTALLTQPDQMALVREDPSRIPAAVEEATRWEAPIVFAPKRVREDTVLEGVALPAGAYVVGFHGYANHDLDRWERPHAFDLTRPRKGTVAFGGGPHFCPGSQLARTEMGVGLAALLEACPNLRLASGHSEPRVMGFQARAVSRIMVEV
ncbi:cytochrome P450 [Phenylobacterium sp.]|uniref:cytochrome P450 n=1 Tax=Phenylobacterium sp. TaxID=1871053 RepID=UPI00301BF078